MSNPLVNSALGHTGESQSARLTVPEIALRLGIGRLAVYAMLEQGIMPGIRLAAVDHYAARVRSLGAHLRDAAWYWTWRATRGNGV